MKVLSAQALVALLLAVGIEQALALPTAGELAPADFDPVHGLVLRDGGDRKGNPKVKPFPASKRNSDQGADGIEELFDADCHAHLCLGAPVVMNWWNGANANRAVGTGNGVGARAIFQNTANFHTATPDATHNVSPEEWPPASMAQGGKPAILYPVTNAAQQTQSGLMSSFESGLTQQQGANGDSKGSWVRIESFQGARGPYCTALNKALENYSSNFNGDGVIKNKPSICTSAINNSGLNGLRYDMGRYAYRITSDTNGYDFVGKH